MCAIKDNIDKNHIILNHVINQEKLLQFVSVVSGSLAQELKKSQTDTREHLEQAVAKIVKKDPEFILKVYFLVE